MDTAISTFASSAFPTLVDVALKGVALLALAGLGTFALRRASAAARHLAWSLAMAGILALPILSAWLPQWRVLPRWAALASSETLAEPLRETHSERVPAEEEPIPTVVERSVATVPLESAEAPASVSTTPESADARAPYAAPERPWREWVAILWALGAALATLPTLAGRLALRRLARSARPADGPPWDGMLSALSRRLGLRRGIILLRSDGPIMPMAWGVRRPRILLPGESDAWPEDRRRAVLLHEMAHVRRRDCLTQLLANLACAMHWFNPLAWIARRRMVAERELACDDLVLAAGFEPGDYAEHLLRTASALRGAPLASAAAIAMARRSKLEGRLLAVLDEKRNRRALTRSLILAGLALAVSVTILLAALRAQTQEKAPEALPPGGRVELRVALRAHPYKPGDIIGSGEWHTLFHHVIALPESSAQFEAKSSVPGNSVEVKWDNATVHEKTERHPRSLVLDGFSYQFSPVTSENGSTTWTFRGSSLAEARWLTSEWQDIITSVPYEPASAGPGYDGPTIHVQCRYVDHAEKPPLSREVASERDRLLAEGDARIRDGILELSKRFPQLGLPTDPTVEEQVANRSPAGMVDIRANCWCAQEDGTEQRAVRDKDQFSILVQISESPESAGYGELPELYPNLRLAGQVRLSAGDKNLEAALKDLVSNALAPLDRLEKGIPADDPKGFGPVIERTILKAAQDTTFFFADLDTGEVMPPPFELTLIEGANRANVTTVMWPDNLRRWVTDNGVDMLVQVSASEFGMKGLGLRRAVNREGTPTTLMDWEAASPTDALDASYQRPGWSHWAWVLDERPFSTPPFFFRTREGGVGVLQIVGLTEDGEGVKIRYKMIQQALAEPTLPGNRVSVAEAASDPEFTFAALCEAVKGPASAIMEPLGVFHENQPFKLLEVLSGETPHDEFMVRYRWIPEPAPLERPVRKGERVIWMLRSLEGARFAGQIAFRGIKALADTPENRKAVAATVPVAPLWGEQMDGVQARLGTKSRLWRAYQVPVLHADLRNKGTREFLSVVAGQRNCQLNVDGQWYQWPLGMQGGMVLPLRVGQTLSDTLVTISPIWQQATEEALRWRQRGGGGVLPESTPHLKLEPGQHTVRVAFVIEPTRVDTGDGFRVVSNAVEIKVTPTEGTSSSLWSVGEELVQAIVGLHRAHWVVVNAAHHEEDRSKVERMLAEATAKARTVEQLSQKTPLSSTVRGYANALSRLREAYAKDEPIDAPANAASRADHRMVNALSGDPNAFGVSDPTQRPKEQSMPAEESAFSPVIERTVNDDSVGKEMFIDLDSGTLHTPPKDLSREAEAMVAWCREKGIDALCETSVSVRGLVCFDMVVHPSTNAIWESGSAGHVVGREMLARGEAGNPVFMTAKGDLPATYMFKTREGGLGILQIVGFNDQPRGVRIRYKKVQSSGELLGDLPETATYRLWLPVYNRNLAAFGTLIALDLGRRPNGLFPDTVHVDLKKHGLQPGLEDLPQRLFERAGQGDFWLDPDNMLATPRGGLIGRLKLPDLGHPNYTFVDRAREMTLAQVNAQMRTAASEAGGPAKLETGEVYGLMDRDGRLYVTKIDRLGKDEAGYDGAWLHLLPLGSVIPTDVLRHKE